MVLGQLDIHTKNEFKIDSRSVCKAISITF